MRKPNGYWKDETVIKELKLTIIKIGRFPTSLDLLNMKKSSLISAITKNGGANKFRKILGYQRNQKPVGYWTNETVIMELKQIIAKIGHFPKERELRKICRQDLVGAITGHGGSNKFRKILGYQLIQKPVGYWTDKKIIQELKGTVAKIGHFPTEKELNKENRGDLNGAIAVHGGFNKFRRILGYGLIRKDKYWTDETVIRELKKIIKKTGYFPSYNTLIKEGNGDLYAAMKGRGGSLKFRGLLGFKPTHKPEGYWTEKTIIQELKEIVARIGHFPASNELKESNRSGLGLAITTHGGYVRFKELLGIPIGKAEKYLSELRSYTGRRGKKSEILVKSILTEWAESKNLPEPTYYKKLATGNVIEFICNVEGKIGIDVTNTKLKHVVYRKWTRKDYYKYLDEFWVVVFSDAFIEEDYIQWNEQCPKNVKVMSITTFLDELGFSIDEDTRGKIDKLEKCTFHNKEKLKHINLEK